MICSICSDKAEGYHFGAISCAACGAFFRRSVSDQKVYSCSSRQCNIAHDPKKRGGSCRFCRFEKCVTSGMMPQDVKAKRAPSSLQNLTSLYRNMSQSSVLLIDQLIIFRRSITAERNSFDSVGGSNRLHENPDKAHLDLI
uniref:DDE_3 domain-containing protein n=1 Tax=Caenorhabditis tropicalis TaxID=1561998 RepID=A0A1I7UX93_9PELO